ncbi:MAG: hypothetical protein OXC68_12640 [Aestuariivita sp.]|nr:hypothetical protein [Aestuariivita sp.]
MPSEETGDGHMHTARHSLAGSLDRPSPCAGMGGNINPAPGTRSEREGSDILHLRPSNCIHIREDTFFNRDPSGSPIISVRLQDRCVVGRILPRKVREATRLFSGKERYP